MRNRFENKKKEEKKDNFFLETVKIVRTNENGEEEVIGETKQFTRKGKIVTGLGAIGGALIIGALIKSAITGDDYEPKEIIDSVGEFIEEHPVEETVETVTGTVEEVVEETTV